MKKIIILLTVMLALTLLLGACFEQDTFAQLNSLLKEDYSKVELTVATTVGNETLTSTVVTTKDGKKTVVDYNLSQFATFEQSIPESYIVSTVGSVVVQDGKIIQQNGQAADITVEQVTAQFHFDASYFIAAQWNGDVFSANVGNVKGFFGDANFNGTAAKVTATVSDGLKDLKVTYVAADGTKVQLSYVFTK